MSEPRSAGLNAAAVTVEVGAHGARSHGRLLGVGLHASSVPVVVCADELVEVGWRGGPTRARGLAIRAGVVHELGARGAVTLWYLEPGVLEWSSKPVSVLSASQRRWLSRHGKALLDGRPASRGVVHPAVPQVLRALRDAPERSVASLASLVELSPSRLRHVFRDETGVNVSRYRWWLRLRVAATAMREGRSLTEAAHEAGFSDAAHFTRTFRRTFGFPPSRLLAAANWR